jgi:hypothetical protein
MGGFDDCPALRAPVPDNFLYWFHLLEFIMLLARTFEAFWTIAVTQLFGSDGQMAVPAPQRSFSFRQ